VPDFASLPFRSRLFEHGRSIPDRDLAVGRAAEEPVAEDKSVKVWDSQTGQQLLTLKGHTAAVKSVAFSPDCKRLASGGGVWGKDEGVVKVWDAQTAWRTARTENAWPPVARAELARGRWPGVCRPGCRPRSQRAQHRSHQRGFQRRRQTVGQRFLRWDGD
jgi:WD40 repeat protein